jgi:hypothetical protein
MNASAESIRQALPSAFTSTTDPLSLAARSSTAWCAWFRVNGTRLLAIPWERGAELSAKERDLIAESLREFQQGEGLEGGHFFRCVRAYAEQTGDWGYLEAHRLFMEEEKRHARDLSRFLKLAGVPLLVERSVLNRVFCWCGSRGGLEMTLAIIVMVEVIAQTYYTALRAATGSEVLRRLCAQILRDEKAHVRFQCERLALLRRGRKRWLLAVAHWVDVLLFLGAGLACWSGHRRTLRAGGYGFLHFWRAAGRKLGLAWKQKDPRSAMSEFLATADVFS